jgi:hypothetical protein
MITIYPKISEFNVRCPLCGHLLDIGGTRWVGFHAGADGVCVHCKASYVFDLPCGHGTIMPYMVNLETRTVYGSQKSFSWLGTPYAQSLFNPKSREVRVKVHQKKKVSKAVLFHCLDFLYGHALLKLLNLTCRKKKIDNAIVLVPQSMAWMVPNTVAEIWTVDLGFGEQSAYYPSVERGIEQAMVRFDQIDLHPCHPLPMDYDLFVLTKTKPFSFDKKKCRITYIWREDRPLKIDGEFDYLDKFRGGLVSLRRQQESIVEIFKEVRKRIPGAVFTVAGLGGSCSFPSWIDDKRATKFTPSLERSMCKVYADSCQVIGVHGSNMLLPSGHAGMTLDIMPDDRWENLGQDILLSGSPATLRAGNDLKYWYIPMGMKPERIATFAVRQMQAFKSYREYNDLFQHLSL